MLNNLQLFHRILYYLLAFLPRSIEYLHKANKKMNLLINNLLQIKFGPLAELFSMEWSGVMEPGNVG